MSSRGSLRPRLDTVTMRIEAILLGAAVEVHQPAEVVRCQSCGHAATTRDGYLVPTPFGDVWICPACNASSALWDSGETCFLGCGS